MVSPYVDAQFNIVVSTTAPRLDTFMYFFLFRSFFVVLIHFLFATRKGTRFEYNVPFFVPRNNKSQFKVSLPYRISAVDRHSMDKKLIEIVFRETVLKGVETHFAVYHAKCCCI